LVCFEKSFQRNGVFLKYSLVSPVRCETRFRFWDKRIRKWWRIYLFGKNLSTQIELGGTMPYRTAESFFREEKRKKTHKNFLCSVW